MITIFNREEVYVGTSMEKFNKVLTTLSENNIEYKHRVVDRNSSNVVGGQRGRTGTFGQDLNISKIYYVYVHKKDYKNATSIIG